MVLKVFKYALDQNWGTEFVQGPHKKDSFSETLQLKMS